MTEVATSKQKIKYDWYQTENQVVLTIMIKGLTQNQVIVNTNKQSLSVTAKLPNGSDYSLELDLAYPIKPERTKIKVLVSKIEISMIKNDGIRWTTLEGDITETNIIQPIPREIMYSNANEFKPTPKNWDKVVADLEEGGGEDDEAALNSLFQKIYKDGTDDLRRAMNKSFQESGGTVLSTNWSEVCKEKVEMKPPDGMEWKKWDE